MSLPEAVAIAGIALGIGFGVGIAFMFYFLYRIFCVLAAAMTGDPLTIRRAMARQPKPAPPKDEGKFVPEIPELGIHAMNENSETMDKLRKKQDSSSDTSQNY